MLYLSAWTAEWWFFSWLDWSFQICCCYTNDPHMLAIFYRQSSSWKGISFFNNICLSSYCYNTYFLVVDRCWLNHAFPSFQSWCPCSDFVIYLFVLLFELILWMFPCWCLMFYCTSYDAGLLLYLCWCKYLVLLLLWVCMSWLVCKMCAFTYEKSEMYGPIFMLSFTY